MPVGTAIGAAQIARLAGATVVLNSALALPLTASLLALCNVVVPKEGEAALLSGLPVHDLLIPNLL